MLHLKQQLVGLPIILSDNIPNDFQFYDKTEYLSLNDSFDKWAEVILKNNKKFDREKSKNIVDNAGYNLKNNIENIERIYIN